MSCWDPVDLLRRVGHTLEFARRMVVSVDATVQAVSDRSPRADAMRALLRSKIATETAMLLLCVEPLFTIDHDIEHRARELARLLIPHARHQDVLAALCLNPGMAGDHGLSHAILARLGFPDPKVDELLSESLASGPSFGPELLPYRRLEQAWRARLWPVFRGPRAAESQVIADTMLGGPLDSLAATRLDLYAFTHAVMYASDLGARPLAGQRPLAAIAADADAALALSLDTNDFDLTAELLLVWPMLRIAWSPTAAFAFTILAKTQDRTGFLPSLIFDAAAYELASEVERSQIALSSSYHSEYVMGFLCAAALIPGRSPPAVVPAAEDASPGATAALLALLPNAEGNACWRQALSELAPRQRDSLAPFLIAVLLRRANTQGDLQLVETVLGVALEHGLVDGPSPGQAARLLRRCQLLSACLED
jgi:hypothetical protein